MAEQHKWHEGAVIYQIYPRSFKDSNGTGVGDLKGIISKLDYLRGGEDSLGVDGIWVSPIYPSPMADFGYDVANYTDIDPLFGNLKDFKKLVKEAHARDLKVILDFVPNHSSDEHPWFVESKSSRDNPKRDWYIWHDPAKDGGLPNNWLSIFNGPAWEFSEETGQYYLHTFLTKQPDLNWENPAVRKAMKDAMRFWLDMGVDGFRVDAVDTLSKDLKFRDDTPNEQINTAITSDAYFVLDHTYSREGPKLFDRLGEMAKVLSEYDNRFMITEAHPEASDRLQGYLDYFQKIDPRLCSPFFFEPIFLPWEAPAFKQAVDDYQKLMKTGYTPVYAIGNHDESRVATRIGSRAARTAAMMLLTLPGSVFIYYGEELGMMDVPIPEDQRQDPGAHRDPERTPMQWSASKYAGFSKSPPWLPLAPDHTEVNVASQAEDPTSMLALYQRLISFRSQSPVLKAGKYLPVDSTETTYCFKRVLSDKKLLTVLNFSDKTRVLTLKALEGIIAISTYLDREKEAIREHVHLRPNEGLLIEVLHD